MTYIVSSGALNSTHSLPLFPTLERAWHLVQVEAVMKEKQLCGGHRDLKSTIDPMPP